MTLFGRTVLRVQAVSARMAFDRATTRAVAGALALGLGFWGWMLKAPPGDAAGWLNNAFRTLQLVTLQFPTAFESGIPWQLQVARLLVPILAALATFHVLVGAITRPVRLALLPRSAGHIVVCGAERVTDGAVAALAARGCQVVLVAPALEASRREALEGIGLTCIEADPLLPATFAALNLRRASALFLTDDDDLVNLNRAMQALAALERRPEGMAPLLLGVLLENEALATELDAALDGLARRHRVHYHRLCPDREGVRLEMQRLAPVFLKPDRAVRSHVLVHGLTGQWQEVLAQLIAAAQDHPTAAPRFTLLLDAEQQAAFTLWRAGRPDLPLVANITVLPPGIAATPEGWEAPHLAVVLLPDAAAVAAALLLRRPGHALLTEHAPVLVRQSRHDLLLGRLGGIEVKGRDLTRLVPFGGLLRTESFERVLDRAGDAVPLALHAAYLTGMPSAAAHAAWAELPENLREANRAAAAHAGILFAAAGFTLGRGAADAPTEAEMAVLGQVEHRRWMADRIERGWRSGAVRDDGLRVHPSLVAFEELEAGEREKDLAQVRTLIGVLADQGVVLRRG